VKQGNTTASAIFFPGEDEKDVCVRAFLRFEVSSFKFEVCEAKPRTRQTDDPRGRKRPRGMI
jgi:hypothetical protein